MRVRDLMTADVACVRTSDPASTAAQMMWERDCGSLPVIDEADRAVAIVTDRDLCMAALFQDCQLRAFPVSRAMSDTLYSCGPDDAVSAAETTMRAHKIRRLPVVDTDRKLLGLLSIADIARAAELGGSGNGRKKNVVGPEDLTATLADICAPRRTAEASSH